jgi:hypothetical protein
MLDGHTSLLLRRWAVPIRTSGGESVTGRAMRVLAAFSAEHPDPSLSEISRRARVPLTTAHRLVGELSAWGALERDARGHSRIGLRLWEVASLAPRTIGLREAALPLMEDLYEATHENVQLAVLDELEVVYVGRGPGPRGRRRRGRRALDRRSGGRSDPGGPRPGGGGRRPRDLPSTREPVGYA